MEKRTTGFLPEVHGFRGIAILFIVASHLTGAYYTRITHGLPWDEAYPWHRHLHEILWHDSTLYFALISGILFSRVLALRGWPAFFKGRFYAVILPYLLISLLLTLTTMASQEHANALASRYLANVLQGKALFVYWYLPVLACLFALTPLLYALARNAPAVLLLVALLPLLVSRTGVIFSLQSAVYFTGMYAIGIYVGNLYENHLERLAKHLPLLLALTIIATLLLLQLKIANIDRSGFTSLQESVFYLQKAAMAAVFLVLLQRGQAHIPRMINRLADHAFAIYLLHWPIIGTLLNAWLQRLPTPAPAWQVAAGCSAIYLAGVLLTLLAAMGFHAIRIRVGALIQARETGC